MTRIDLYRNVHKGQRALLFGLAADLGRADHEDRSGVEALVAGLRSALDDLRQHSVNEETFIHPLLRDRAPDIAAALDHEHEAMKPSIIEVEELILKIEADGTKDGRAQALLDLYRAWCRMVASYLVHIDREECVAMPRLWETCSDAEILSAIRHFVASRSITDQLKDLSRQAPALTPYERAVQVRAMSQNPALPAEALIENLSDVLSANAMDRLRADAALP